jgi:hypothetical protein
MQVDVVMYGLKPVPFKWQTLGRAARRSPRNFPESPYMPLEPEAFSG